MSAAAAPQSMGLPPSSPVVWKAIIRQYQEPCAGRATWQMVNTLGSYAALWALMYWSLAISWWLTAPLAVLARAMLVRVFIIFHDCGHGSFFPSRLANDLTGFIVGNIGIHHIHHLSPRIPNYNLERCHQSHPIFQTVKPLTLLASFKSITFHLWDEQRRKLVSFRELRRQRHTT